jgi:PAS domain S-box-containing protein
MFPKKNYDPPILIRRDSESDFPAAKRNLVRLLQRQAQGDSYIPTATQDCMTIVDLDRRYVHVSDEFCKLVGFAREELLGKQYDELSAPEANDIPTVFNLFCQLEYMHGLWMLVHRNGARILVRYESWLRSDMLIEGHMELVAPGI